MKKSVDGCESAPKHFTEIILRIKNRPKKGFSEIFHQNSDLLD